MNNAGKDIKRILELEKQLSLKVAQAKEDAEQRIAQAYAKSDAIKFQYRDMTAEYEKNKSEEFNRIKKTSIEKNTHAVDQLTAQLRNKYQKEHDRLTQIALRRLLPYEL